jgi:hypothetical protein
MAEFEHFDDYRRFTESVLKRARYRQEPFADAFIKTVLETSKSRAGTIKEGQVLFRAQLGAGTRIEEQNGEEFEVDAAYDSKRMVPTPEFAVDGRVNPRGIPCLYLASNKATAVAEVRPWVGSYVSLAEFKVMKDCEMLDCSRDKQRGIMFLLNNSLDMNPENREGAVWGDISYAFSKPVAADDRHSDYIPTQILAEAFKHYGYDWIVYRSLLGREDGKNIALFDIPSADLMNCCLYKINSVDFNFDQTDNPYYVLKHYPEIQQQIEEREAKEPSGPEIPST